MSESAGESADPRVLAGTMLVAALLVSGVGLFLVPDAPFTFDLTALIPLMIGALGVLVVILLVDPVLTPKQRPTQEQVAAMLTRTFFVRLPVMELPALSGLVIAVVYQARSPLLFGAIGTLMLGSLWWPGEQFVEAMRRRLAPVSASHVVDEVLARSDGHFRLVRHH